MNRTRLRSLALLAAAALLRAGTDSPLNANLSINYQPPGARSQAMGGAFIGLADDATAAIVNPAGLIQLSKPELMTQLYSGTTGLDIHNFRGLYVERTGAGFSGTQVSLNDLKGARSFDSAGGVNFISYAQPFSWGVVALSASRPVDYSISGYTQGQEFQNHYFFTPPPPPCVQFAINCVLTAVNDKPQDYAGRVRSEQLTAAMAIKLHDKFSMGLSLGYVRTQQHFVNRFFLQSNRTLPGNLQFTITDTGKSSDWVGAFGLQYRPNDKWQYGFSYRHGAAYESTATLDVRNSGLTSLANDTIVHRSKLPDTAGIGIVWRPIPVFVIATDIVHVRYSQLSDDLRTFAQDEVDLGAHPGAFDTEDGLEYHLGLEYVQIIGGAPAVFRLGAWQEKAHGLKYRAGSQYFSQDPSTPIPVPDPDAYDRFAQSVMASRFPGGEDLRHYSAGIGFVIGQKVQLDTSYDYSKLSKMFMMSMVYRFGHN